MEYPKSRLSGASYYQKSAVCGSVRMRTPGIGAGVKESNGDYEI